VVEQDPPTAAVLEPVSILLVDDHPENLFALKAILASPDHHLVTASSGKEALALLPLREDFALILLDVSMPAMDGFEVAHRMKRSERTKHIPIVFVTAIASDASQVSKGYSVGAVDYLIKPLQPLIVRSKVRVFVDLYRQRRMSERRAAAVSEAKCQGYELRLAELRVAADRRYQRLVAGTDRTIGWLAKADTLRLSFVSRRAQKLLGYAPMEYVAPDFWARHVHPEDRAPVLAALRQAIIDRTDQECVHRFFAADGRELWFRTGLSVEAVEGGTGEIHGISFDITDLKRAEADRNLLVRQLDEARQRFLDLSNDLDEAIVWEIDAATMRSAFVSRRGETITGFPCAEWMARPDFWSAHVPAEDWATLQEAFLRSKSQALGERCEHRFIRRDGAVLRMRTTIHFTQSGQSPRFQGVSLDVTAQREADDDSET
jgi:PAS domain S-box-containing protein